MKYFKIILACFLVFFIGFIANADFVQHRPGIITSDIIKNSHPNISRYIQDLQNQNSYLAYITLGILYYEGIQVAPNKLRAKKYFHQAIANRTSTDNKEAYAWLGRFYYESKSIKDKYDHNLYMAEIYLKEAEPFFIQSLSESGSQYEMGHAYFFLSQMYKSPRTKTLNAKQAPRFFKTVLKNIKKQARLIELENLMNHVEQYSTPTESLLKKQDKREIYLALLSNRQNKQAGSKDAISKYFLKKSESYYKNAKILKTKTNSELALVYFLLGRIYSQDTVIKHLDKIVRTPKNYNKARKFFEKSIKLGYRVPAIYLENLLPNYFVRICEKLFF